MLTQHGPKCDVCGSYIITGNSINPFSMPGIPTTLCCHDDCKPKLLAAVESKDWNNLPEGPIKELFRENTKEQDPK